MYDFSNGIKKRCVSRISKKWFEIIYILVTHDIKANSLIYDTEMHQIS